MAGPWEKYQQPAQPAPAEGPWARYQADALAQAQAAPITDLEPVQAVADPTEDMSNGELFAAGAGKKLSDSWLGMRQLAADAVAMPLNAVGGILDAWGVDERVAPAGAINRTRAQLQGEAADRERLDAPLMSRGAAMAGYGTAAVGEAVLPGAVLKLGSRAQSVGRVGAAMDRARPALTRAGNAMLPTTARGAAAQGAALGAIQPAKDGNQRVQQIAVGGAGGAAGVLLPRAAGAGFRAVRNVAPPLTRKAQERAAARVIDDFATSPETVRRLAQYDGILVPGSRPTTAEATGDIGLAGLQHTLRIGNNDFRESLILRQQANNAARVQAIEAGFGGADDAAAAAIREQRDRAAAATARQLRNVRAPAAAPSPFTGVGVAATPVEGAMSLKPVEAALGALIQKADRRPAVQSALSYVRNLTTTPVRNLEEAWNLRKTIGDLMDGKLGGDQAAATAARRELITVRSILDREMTKAFPGWHQSLRNYKTASRAADQVDVGAELLATGKAVRSATNEPQLTPAAFSRAAGNLDQTVQRATGFRRSTADSVITPQQKAVVESVRQDLERFGRTQTDTLPPGSATVQNAIGTNELRNAVGPVGAAVIEPASGVAMLALGQMRKAYGEKVAAVVHDAMLNPQRAAQILATLDPTVRTQIIRQVAPLLARASPVAGVALPNATP